MARNMPGHMIGWWTRASYAIVIFLLTADGLYAQIGDIKITATKALSILFSLLLLAHASYSGRVKTGGLGGYVLFLWMLLSLVVDFAHLQTEGVLRHWVNLAAGVIWFYIVANLSLDWKVFQSALLRVAAVLGGLSLAVVVTRPLSLDPTGLTGHLVQREVDLERLTMFSWEPNIFGAIVAIGLLMTLPTLEVKVRRAGPVIGLLLVALVGSFSKGPWLAFAVGMLVYVLLTRAKRAAKLLLALAMVGTASVLLMVATHPHLLEKNVIRASNVDVRWIQIERGFRDIVLSPLFGNGTFSFGSLWPDLNLLFGSSESGSAWISQAAIGVLHDTGIVGLMLMLLFWCLVIFRAVSSIMLARRQGLPREFVLFASALVASAISLLVQDWITTLYSLPIYWAVIGLVAYIPRWVASFHDPRVVAR